MFVDSGGEGRKPDKIEMDNMLGKADNSSQDNNNCVGNASAKPFNSRQNADFAHVLFFDLAGYSLLKTDEGGKLVEDIFGIISETSEFKRAQGANELLLSPAGDGAAIVFLRDPAAPVRCALEIRQAIKARPEIRIRMGINTGPCQWIRDLNGDEIVAGAAINYAQRAMDCGKVGNILLTETTAKYLLEFSTWAKHIQDLGEFNIKHGKIIHLYGLVKEPQEQSYERNVAGEPLKRAKTQKVALLYKRGAKPDDQVLTVLESGLQEAGHIVFVDRHLRAGVEWAREIEQQVREADAVIPLLSNSSMQSEMMSTEVQIAADAGQQRFGKPRILPVRIGSDITLSEPLLSILGRLQHAVWNSIADNEPLLKELLDGLDAKEQPKAAKSEMPGGAVPLDSRYYIVQPPDIEFYEGVQRQDGLLLVKGARQMGKTSLLARGLQLARQAGKTVVFLDLQKLNYEDLRNLTNLYKALGGMIADQLNLDVYPDDKWRAGRAPNINFEQYIVREVLGNVEGHLIIAMDEVDRLFSFDFASEMFGMIRSWFNDRSTNPDLPWGRLTQALVYATEPHLFITDQFQSPFNVGTKLELHDFTIDQVARLNELYDQPLQSTDDLERFYALFHGHPYLSRRGFYELTRYPARLTLHELVSQADMDEGPFGDHLRRLLIIIARDNRTMSVIAGMLHGKPIPDMRSFYGLRSGGLISGHSLEDARFRCAIYETYLKRHLSR